MNLCVKPAQINISLLYSLYSNRCAEEKIKGDRFCQCLGRVQKFTTFTKG
jgi:hypothetical protein